MMLEEFKAHVKTARDMQKEFSEMKQVFEEEIFELKQTLAEQGKILSLLAASLPREQK